MGPDGYPRPPESVLARQGRGRRIRPHHQDASRWRPRADRTKRAYNVLGIIIKDYFLFYWSSFRDGPKDRARNPYTAAQGNMDSGLATAWRPGMTDVIDVKQPLLE